MKKILLFAVILFSFNSLLFAWTDTTGSTVAATTGDYDPTDIINATFDSATDSFKTIAGCSGGTTVYINTSQANLLQRPTVHHDISTFPLPDTQMTLIQNPTAYLTVSQVELLQKPTVYLTNSQQELLQRPTSHLDISEFPLPDSQVILLQKPTTYLTVSQVELLQRPTVHNDISDFPLPDGQMTLLQKPTSYLTESQVTLLQRPTAHIDNFPTDYPDSTAQSSLSTIETNTSLCARPTVHMDSPLILYSGQTVLISSGTAGKLTGVTSATITVSDKVSGYSFLYKNNGDTSTYSQVKLPLIGDPIYLSHGDSVADKIEYPVAVTFQLSELAVTSTMQYVIRTIK